MQLGATGLGDMLLHPHTHFLPKGPLSSGETCPQRCPQPPSTLGVAPLWASTVVWWPDGAAELSQHHGSEMMSTQRETEPGSHGLLPAWEALAHCSHSARLSSECRSHRAEPQQSCSKTRTLGAASALWPDKWEPDAPPSPGSHWGHHAPKEAKRSNSNARPPAWTHRPAPRAPRAIPALSEDHNRTPSLTTVEPGRGPGTSGYS